MHEENGGSEEEEQHKFMNLILDKELNNIKMRSSSSSTLEVKPYCSNTIEETSPILIHNYSNQKTQMDDPTLREVLGVISTPDSNLKSMRNSEFLRSSNNIENEGYRLNRQLITDYKNLRNSQDSSFSPSNNLRGRDSFEDISNNIILKEIINVKEDFRSSRFGGEEELQNSSNLK